MLFYGQYCTNTSFPEPLSNGIVSDSSGRCIFEEGAHLEAEPLLVLNVW